MIAWSLALVPALAGLAVAAAVRSRVGLGVGAGLALGLTLALALVAPHAGPPAAVTWSEALVLTVALTPVSATAAVLVPLIALPVAGYAAAHEDRAGLTRLIAVLLVFVGAMELLVIAADFLTLLIAWELVGACSMVLIAQEWGEPGAQGSGIYAFLATRLGDLGLFVAAFACFAATGSFAYAGLGQMGGAPLAVVGFGVLVAAAAKSGEVPFAPWLFRAMDGPTSVSALLHAATMVAAGAYLLIRLQPYLAPAPGFAAVAVGLGLATALAGGAVAILQPHAKKLLAASTSAHYGLMFVAVGAGYPAVALMHLVAHAGFKALLFLAAGIAGETAGSFALRRLALGRVLPATAALAGVGAVALAAVPPLGAAWTKEAVVAAAEHRGAAVAAAVVLAGGLSATYAARFQLLAFGGGGRPRRGYRPRGAEIAGLAVLAALTLVLSVLWLPRVHEAVGSFLGGAVPSGSRAWVAASLLLAAAGLVSGAVLARAVPRLGAAGWPAAAADWLGLPTLIHRAVTRPVEQAAAAAARLDDAALDGIPRAAAAAARAIARVVADADRRLVDRAVAATAALTEGMAGVWDRLAEALSDRLPEGSARLVGVLGSEAPRLQTGLSHHYYAILAGGAALMILTLLLIG